MKKFVCFVFFVVSTFAGDLTMSFDNAKDLSIKIPNDFRINLEDIISFENKNGDSIIIRTRKTKAKKISENYAKKICDLELKSFKNSKVDSKQISCDLIKFDKFTAVNSITAHLASIENIDNIDFATRAVYFFHNDNLVLIGFFYSSLDRLENIKEIQDEVLNSIDIN